MRQGKELGTLDGLLHQFWTAVMDIPQDAAQDEVNEILMDTADAIFLEFDAASKGQTSIEATERLGQKIEEVRACLKSHNVEMGTFPQQT